MTPDCGPDMLRVLNTVLNVVSIMGLWIVVLEIRACHARLDNMTGRNKPNA